MQFSACRSHPRSWNSQDVILSEVEGSALQHWGQVQILRLASLAQDDSECQWPLQLQPWPSALLSVDRRRMALFPAHSPTASQTSCD